MQMSLQNEMTIRFCRSCNSYRYCWLVTAFVLLNYILPDDFFQQVHAQKTQRTQSASDIDDDAIQKLVLDLADNSRRVRLAAEQRLLELGPQILPLLPEPDEDTDASVRLAVQRIRRELEFRQSEAIFRPSTFSLNGTFTLQQVLKRLSEQTGNVIDQSQLDASMLAKIVECQFQKKPFWTCLSELAGKHGFAWKFKDRQLVLLPANADVRQPLHETNSGAVHVTLSSGTVFDVPGSEFTKHWKTTLRLSIEPRLQPLAIRYATDDITANSSKTKFEPFVSGAKYDRVLSGGTRQAIVPLQFLIPSNLRDDANVTLKGTINLVCASPNQKFEISTRSSAAETFQKGLVTLTVTPSSSGRDTYFEIAANYRNSPFQFESHFASVLPGSEVLKLKDKTVSPRQATILGESDTHRVSAAFKTVDVLQAEKLVIHRPVALRTVSVPFELQDVTLNLKRTANLPARESR